VQPHKEFTLVVSSTLHILANQAAFTTRFGRTMIALAHERISWRSGNPFNFSGTEEMLSAAHGKRQLGRGDVVSHHGIVGPAR
jgi:hypothetical protein